MTPLFWGLLATNLLVDAWIYVASKMPGVLSFGGAVTSKASLLRLLGCIAFVWHSSVIGILLGGPGITLGVFAKAFAWQGERWLVGGLALSWLYLGLFWTLSFLDQD